MAEEEIVIIEEEDAADIESSQEKDKDKDSPLSQKFSLTKKKIIIIGSIVIVLLLTLTLFLLLRTSSTEPKKDLIDITSEQTKKEKIKKLSSSELEQMIKRANVLYEKGYKNDALKLYEKIAIYSESISYYNLGVAELKDKQYKKAINSFDLAIRNRQNLCVSAINAAVASLELRDKEKFEYYINMAHSYLPSEASKPLYSYYYALINFYKENYLEALSPLGHRTSEYYENTQNQLHAKINLLFSSYNTAIADLEENYQDENALTLGLLYANIGDISLAKRYLRAAITQGISPVKSQLALAYVDLKSGQVHEAATLIENLAAMYPQEIYKHYPIETFLKESLFDINLAQNNFHKNIIHNQNTIYQILFYFAPYKIFNANKTISYIRKGNANISIDNISGASQYLSESASLSSVNMDIAKSIQLALNFRLQEANTKLKNLVDKNSRNSIAQYNLALTYAQLGEMPLAYEHFIKSYHLNAKNYLAGIFAIMSSKVINQENKKFNLIIKENLVHEPNNQEYDFYRALIHFKEGNFPATYNWMEKNTKEQPLYIAFNILISMSMNKEKLAQKYSQKLIKLLPNDILPHLIYIDTFYSKEENKIFARKAIKHLKSQNFTMNDYYYGPFIAQYLYTQYAQITGTLYPLKLKLKEKLSTEQDSYIRIMQALALVDIYTKDFEEAYTIYNELIDTHKQQDSHTLFLAAIAAMGASHPANAIALLEIAKRKNPKHNESRYALGLLYLQTQNVDGAVVAFKALSQPDFQSQFFNFRVIKGTSKNNI